MKLPAIVLLIVFSGLFCGNVASASQPISALPDTSQALGIPDEDVPYGIASGYMFGRALLRDGKSSEALPYLHMAYRAQPNVITIAQDFKTALAQEGYFNDALEVVNKLVEVYPDSLGFLADRAELNLKAGRPAPALADLRELRRRGHVTLGILEAEASILTERGKVNQALDVYRDGLDLLPENGAELYLGMSGVLQKAEQSDSILPLMEEALGRYPDEPRFWLVKLRVQVVMERDDEALATAQAADTHFAMLAVAAAAADTFGSDAPATSASPHLPPDSFVVELADFYAQRHNLDKAMGILRPLSEAGELQLAPSLWLGRLLLGTNRTEEGEALVNNILERWPESGRGWFLRGKAFEGRGDWEGAIPDFARAVELTPRDPELRLGYVRAMLVAWGGDLGTDEIRDGQEEDRSTVFRRHLMVASTLVPERDYEGQLILGYGFKALEDYERAVWRFGIAAESKELRLNALLQQSICLDVQGDESKAENVLETLYREFPENPEVANSLGYFLAEKGRSLDKARVLVTEALAVDPGNGAFLDSMGWIEYRLGNLEESLDYLIRAVNVLPDDPVILEHLGMVLRDQGKTEEALGVLRRALDQGGDAERLETLIGDLSSEGSGEQ